MTAYVFYMGEVEIYPDLPSPDKHILGTWICLIQRGEQCWGQLEEVKRIKHPPLRNWFSRTTDQAPKEFRTQLLLSRG